MSEDERNRKIAEHQENIFALERIQHDIKKSVSKDLEINIKTEHWYSSSISSLFAKQKSNKIYIIQEIAEDIVKAIIQIEKDCINKIIDNEIKERSNKDE
jgi:hypothetical protein